jgi:predicted DNA-binding antitoxin AbrB/MazE fold protein
MKAMSKTIKGVVEGNVIVPKGPAVLPEGTEVTINVPTNIRLVKHVGVWRNLEGLDELTKEIYKNRTFKREVPL